MLESIQALIEYNLMTNSLSYGEERFEINSIVSRRYNPVIADNICRRRLEDEFLFVFLFPLNYCREIPSRSSL